jgi:MoaA/NifB/PqqE/SkfB family radical SAM enzyme
VSENRNLESLVIEITQACPLKCVGCYVPPEPYYMNLDDFKTIVQKLPKVDTLNLSGGEPFLHPNLIEMVDFAKSQGHHVTIFTSGNANHNTLPLLKGKVDVLRVTLKYPNSTLDSYWRKHEDSFKNTVAFLKQTQQLQIPTYVHIVVDRFSIEYAVDTIHLVRSLGAEPIILPFIDFTGKLQGYTFRWEDFTEIAKNLRKQNVTVEMVEEICIAGVHRLAINAHGEVRPCVYIDGRLKLGNLLTESWATVYPRLTEWRGKLGVYRGRCPAYDDKNNGWVGEK